jgi:hypothetical protein
MDNLPIIGGPETRPSTSTLSQKGVAAAGFLLGGIGLSVLGGLPAIPGVVLGALAAIIGSGSVFSHNRDDRIGGTALLAGGLLALVSKLPLFGPLRPLAGVAIAIGAVACIGLAILNGLKFLKGLRERR